MLAADPLTVSLTRMNARTAKALGKLGLETSGDLLRHYPRRYAEPGTLTDMASLRVGEHVTVVAEVLRTSLRPTAQGRGLLQSTITDGHSRIELTFFASHVKKLEWRQGQLRPGRRGLFTGEVSLYRDTLQLMHPECRLFGADDDEHEEDEALVEAGRPIPVYPAVAGFESWKVAQAVRTVLDPLREQDVPDPVPPQLRERDALPTLLEALRLVHVPQDEADWQRGRARLRYEEALVLQAELARRRARVAREEAVARPAREGGLLEAFDARLPFTLTAGQRAVGEEIAGELAAPRPMQRLLQGEVGSGKTVVALRAMLQVVDAGGQAALLAPTEVLAAQHARTLRGLLGDLAEGGFLGGADPATRVALLTGSLPTMARRSAMLDAASGSAGIVVGTHALLSQDVQFADLGLVVVDEQHRFGVEQRDALRAKAGRTPHTLVMTATPIPRTVAMTVFGDLETSVLSEVPAGRQGITTHVVPADNPRWTDRTWQRVREEVDGGGRAYVVCPRIDGDAAAGDAVDEDGADLVLDAGPTVGAPDAGVRRPLRAVLDVAEELRARPDLTGVGVGVLHGRLAPEEKDRAFAAFATGEAPVLVSTTVVEVGVDVPDATVMVVLDADRFGISQLHQLRGRVGRGTRPGLCLLVSAAQPGTDAHTRLETLAATTDGFELAALDLELRHEGDVLGAAQHGRGSSLRLLRVTRDADVIARARTDARALVEQDGDLDAWPALRAAIETSLAGEREEFLDRA
ncbi:ATP-dependent DNA helicase RecG [Cellulomonas xiejunii]|uniref:ATP-dependent DNA helicase RecG n=1 Tax=Cellulomonas xiejunii TaxID=2968083 RepID=A0ABY5KKI1_9CELL|nr:ATP-dependent DNA helicase RecG [Cellulomonas xiejunii]MCC2320144.1 ATP-dependent DNA helicase RecG [Cellulomonas xiejunii]UUI70453.1 ATP-dependent DNA helicase RecG [Cellulomonas xiejunii]